MTMLIEMTKVHIIGHRRQLDQTLTALHEMKIVHLIDVSEDASVPLPPLAVDEQHLRRIEEFRYLRARLGSLLALLPQPSPSPEEPIELSLEDIEDLREDLAELVPLVEEKVGRIDALSREQETLPRHVASLTKLLPLVPELAELRGYGTAVLLVEERHAVVLGDLNARLAEDLGGNFEIISDHVDDTTVGAVLVFPRIHADEVQAMLGREAISRVRLPRQYEAMPFREAIGAMKRRLIELPDLIQMIKDELDELVASHRGWAAAAAFLDGHLDQLGAIHRLGATTHTFVMSGWVPTNEIDSIERALVSQIGEEVIIEESPAGVDEVPPVLMHNPAPARPFEFLVRLLAIPRYGSIDPTLLVALFVPLFFGIMLGDVVYGVALLTLALLANHRFRHRSSALRDLSRVFILLSAWAIVWGVVYGEYLGDLGHRWLGIEPIWLNREEALEPLLLFAIAIGATHITLGLILGVYQAIRSRQRRTAVERVTLLFTLAALFSLAAIAAEILPGALLTPSFAGGQRVVISSYCRPGRRLGLSRARRQRTRRHGPADSRCPGGNAVSHTQSGVGRIQPDCPGAASSLCGVLREILRRRGDRFRTLRNEGREPSSRSLRER
jgi:V/A-type H+-transporting ATPase subunit I